MVRPSQPHPSRPGDRHAPPRYPLRSPHFFSPSPPSLGRQRSSYHLHTPGDSSERNGSAAPFRPAVAHALPIGGGFIEALLTGGLAHEPQRTAPTCGGGRWTRKPDPEPQFQRREVDYTGPEAPGTIVVDTPDKLLFLIEPHGKALRYGIGVGSRLRMGRIKRISRKSEWPDWTPPPEMLLRRPIYPATWPGDPVIRWRQSPLSRLLALPHSRHQ